jgi:hypothetical protein
VLCSPVSPRGLHAGRAPKIRFNVAWGGGSDIAPSPRASLNLYYELLQGSPVNCIGQKPKGLLGMGAKSGMYTK